MFCLRFAAPGRVAFAASARSLLDDVLLADTQRLLGDRERAVAALPALERRLVLKAGDRSAIIAAAALVELGAATLPGDPRWSGRARDLISLRAAAGWGDTFTTAAVVRALTAVVTAPGGADVPLTIQADGREVGMLAGSTDSLTVNLPGVQRLALVPSGAGCEDCYTVCVTVRPRAEAVVSVVAAPTATVSTRVFAVQPKRQEHASDASGRVTVARGKTLEVVLEVQLARPMSHARLTWPRPCGVEFVRAPRLGEEITAVEERDDALHLFFERWEKGTHRVVLVVRAEVSGDIACPPPELAPMYDDTPPLAVISPKRWTVR